MNVYGWKQMLGTESTGEYRVIARTPVGRVGVRSLGGGMAHIRVEPLSDEGIAHLFTGLTRQEGWKQPGENGQNRFSTVEYGKQGIATVEGILRLMAEGGSLERNPAYAAHTWRSAFAATV